MSSRQGEYTYCQALLVSDNGSICIYWLPFTKTSNTKSIVTPPTGGLGLFNLYSALSWSLGRSTIRLLQDFDDKLFQTAHQPKGLAEDDRLEELNGKNIVMVEKDGTGQ